MAFDTISILKGRMKVAAKGKVSSDFWVSEGFSSVKGMVNASKVGPNSLVRIRQGVDPQRSDRERVIKVFDPNLDISIVEPVTATMVKVDYENDLDEQVEVAIDIGLRKQRIQPDEVRFRDFFNRKVPVKSKSSFKDNVVNIQESLGRPITALHIQLPSPTDVLEIKINDEETTPFVVKGERKFTPEEDQLEVCRLFLSNSGADIEATIFGT